MKICSLYGAGFFYIPGTDTCIKVGGFVRSEWLFNSNGSFAPYINGAASLYTRNTNDLLNRSRGVMSWDVRSQTAYGTLRSYLRAGWQWTSNDPTVGGSSGTVYLDRAFIQLGGWTFGKTQSFYDFFPTPVYSNQTNFLWMDTGGSGTPVLAYTASFGNGFSATISLEDGTEQRLPVVGVAPGFVLAAGATNPISNGGYQVPDIVGNLRIDQAWGSAQIAAAAHQNRANYYAGANQMSHPSDKWGFAVGGGVTFNLPMLAKGDTFSIAANYCSGATRYCSNGTAVTGNGAGYGAVNGGTIGVGWLDDAYFNSVAAAGGGLELPHAWNIMAGVQHYWVPNVRTSLYGGYLNYKANSNVVDTVLCPGVANVAVAAGGPGGVQGAGCLDWSAWQVGSRTVWNPVANLDLSVDVLYERVRSAAQGAAFATAAQGLPPVLQGGNTDHWHGMFRVQRNFWP